ncbi:secreted protein [Melampsora americana]|nr:secreted protein [Melampsora americana]
MIFKFIYPIVLLLCLCTTGLKATDTEFTLPADPSSEAIRFYNISKVATVNRETKNGSLSWGASKLPFGSGAGAGINWHPSFIGGGFNAGSEKNGTAAIGGGWSIEDHQITIGFGLKWEGQNLDVSINGLKGGKLVVKIDGKSIDISS